MKKLLVLGLFLGTVGNIYALEKADITFGTYIESENYNGKYRDEDVTIHGFKTKIQLKEVPLWTKFAYEYRKANSSSEYAKDSDRYKFMIGSDLNYGNLSLKPEYELRITDERKATTKRTENRFKPNWDYKVDNQITVFNDWMLGYRADKDHRGYESTKTWDEYFHEIETGIKYNIADNQALKVSLYNEYEKAEKAEMEARGKNENEWQLRLGYEKEFSNGISVSPFTRLTLDSKTKNSDGSELKTNNKGRYGVQVAYQSDNGIGVYSETYYENQKSKLDGQKQSDKNETFFKLGMNYTF